MDSQEEWDAKLADALSQALCMACGLCCDGTIFAIVPVRDTDNIRPLEGMQAKFFVRREENRFEQPCPAYAKPCCQIYADRPTNCQKFRCKLLTAFFERKITPLDAQMKINMVISLKENLLDSLQLIDPSLPGMAWPKLLKLWNSLANGDDGLAFRQKYGTVLTQMFALRWYLWQHFHGERKTDIPS